MCNFFKKVNKNKNELVKFINKLSIKIVMKKESVKEKVKRSLKSANHDAIATSAMIGFGERYISAFAIALGASNLIIGLLTALPQSIAPLFQLYALRLLRYVNRKKLVLFSVLLQSLMWIPILLIPFIFKKIGVYLIVPFVILYFLFGGFGGPAWVSWMGDLVNKSQRGIYFGKRNEMAGLTSLVAVFIAGYVLDLFSKGFVGFAIIFGLASMFRLIAFFLINKMYEPKLVLEQKYYFSLFKFIQRMKNNNFGRFVIYIALLNLTANIAGPFYAVYMLRDLAFSYKMFMFVTITASIISFLSMPLWGKFGDKYGNVRVMKITAYLVTLMPFLWMFYDNFYYILAIQLVGGFAWAGMNLSHLNFIYDTVTQQRRAICSCYLNILRGIGIAIGAIGGGLVANYVHVDYLKYSIYLVFLLSGIFRFLIIPIILHVKEVRPVEKRPLHHIFDTIHDSAFSKMRGLYDMFGISKK